MRVRSTGSEFEQGLRLLNISVRQPVLDTLLDIIDAEDNDDGGNDHDIGFKEFARVMQASDVFKMSALAPRPQEVNPMLSAREEARKAALKYLRPGVSQEELRKFQEQVTGGSLRRDSSPQPWVHRSFLACLTLPPLFHPSSPHISYSASILPSSSSHPPPILLPFYPPIHLR